MPATGRSYYPNTPGPLEQALAPSVADGTSVWGPLMMMSARHERQQAIDDVNETQAQQFMLGLKSALEQAHVKAEGDIYGQQLRGGHDDAAGMEAANLGGFGHYSPEAIATARFLGNAAQVAGIGKDINTGANQAAQAGQGSVLSGLGEQVGLPTYQGTPLGVQEHNIAAGATMGAAELGLQGQMYATDHKPPKTPTEKQDTLQLTGGYGTYTHYMKPGEKLSPDAQRELEIAKQNAGIAVQDAGQSDTQNPTQDPPEKDPGWAEQVAALIAQRHTNPVFVKRTTQGGKKGKMVEVDDPSHPGHRTVKFVTDPIQ